MAWKCTSMVEQRKQLIRAYVLGLANMTDLCRQYNISRRTGYKWYNRFLVNGEEGLEDLPRSPHNPHRLYSSAQIDMMLALKWQHRNWGPKKILIKLKEKYPKMDWPSPTRLYEIFKEYHLVSNRKIRNRVPATAPLGDLQASNDTWAVDLKGWFLTGDGHKCEPLTITDCFSRYLVRCIHLENHSAKYVWPVFEEAFREYGLPLRVRSDNGPPFGSTAAGRLTRLSINLIKAGVTPEWIQPGHPEENGRHERFHLTLKQEVANPPKDTLAQQIQAMSQFEHEYNFDRPHEALDMKTPGACYQASPRTWDGILRPPEYDTKETQVRKVRESGSIKLSSKEYFIGHSLVGEYVALKNTEEDELDVYYGPIFLGKINDRGFEKPKIATRRQR